MALEPADDAVRGQLEQARRDRVAVRKLEAEQAAPPQSVATAAPAAQGVPPQVLAPTAVSTSTADRTAAPAQPAAHYDPAQPANITALVGLMPR